VFDGFFGTIAPSAIYIAGVAECFSHVVVDASGNSAIDWSG
jgi:hypothetical protein